MNRLLKLVGWTIVFWLLLVFPVRFLLGEPPAVYCTVAMLLCLVPTALTLSLANFVGEVSPEQQLIVILGGTGLRMAVVLLAPGRSIPGCRTSTSKPSSGSG